MWIWGSYSFSMVLLWNFLHWTEHQVLQSSTSVLSLPFISAEQTLALLHSCIVQGSVRDMGRLNLHIFSLALSFILFSAPPPTLLSSHGFLVFRFMVSFPKKCMISPHTMAVLQSAALDSSITSTKAEACIGQVPTSPLLSTFSFHSLSSPVDSLVPLGSCFSY